MMDIQAYIKCNVFVFAIHFHPLLIVFHHVRGLVAEQSVVQSCDLSDILLLEENSINITQLINPN